MSSVTLNLPPVVEYQHKALWGDFRYGIVDGSTKCGKTYPCLIWLLEHAGKATGPNQHVWWVAPIFVQSEIAFNRLVSMLTQADPDHGIWAANKSKMTVTIKGPNGRTIWFKSADTPDSLYGEDVWACVVDEGTRCPEEAWWAIRSTLTATRGPVRIISNVKGRKNWVYKLGQRAKAGEANMHYAKITAYDAVEAGILDASEIEDAKSTLPEAVFRELFLAEPSEDGGNPFGLQHIAKARRKIINPGPVVQRGIDLAKKQDWTVNLGMDAIGQVVDFQRWQRVPWDITTDRLAESIGSTFAEVDSTGIGDAIVDGLKKRCPNVNGYVFSMPSKQRLMECLAVALQSGLFIFDDDVLQAELEIFEYEYVASGVRYTAPEGFHDDTVYAAGLCCYGIAMRPRPYTYFGVDKSKPNIERKEGESVFDHNRRVFAMGLDDDE